MEPETAPNGDQDRITTTAATDAIRFAFEFQLPEHPTTDDLAGIHKMLDDLILATVYKPRAGAPDA